MVVTVFSFPLLCISSCQRKPENVVFLVLTPHSGYRFHASVVTSDTEVSVLQLENKLFHFLMFFVFRSVNMTVKCFVPYKYMEFINNYLFQKSLTVYLLNIALNPNWLHGAGF
jgi:hypothetical protein